MTDIALDSNNDLAFTDGQISLITTIEELTRQRILNKLRAFTGTLFTNVNYGINADLMFEKGTQGLLDQNIKTLISETIGVTQVVDYVSQVGVDRTYSASFTYQIETGEIVGISNLGLGSSYNTAEVIEGIWIDGVWDYSGLWADEEVWEVGL